MPGLVASLRGGARTSGAALLVLLLVVCFGTLPWSAPRMREQKLEQALQPPSWRHSFGTDEVGRSLLWRTLYGGAISLTLGLVAAVVAVLFGTSYGAVAGYLGGGWDAVMMRIVDVLYALPSLLLIMLGTVSLGAALEHASGCSIETSRFVVLVLVIGGTSWLTIARVVRGQVLSLREQPFVVAARALGLPAWRIVLRHVLPHLWTPVTVFAALVVPQAILQESFLSFLGVGIPPPQATWGSLTADGLRLVNAVRFDWWLVVFPAGALAVTLLALNLAGEGLGDRPPAAGR